MPRKLNVYMQQSKPQQAGLNMHVNLSILRHIMPIVHLLYGRVWLQLVDNQPL